MNNGIQRRSDRSRNTPVILSCLV